MTGSLVVVCGALAVQLTFFVPELLALAAGWLLLLGVWKDLPVLVTAAVVLVVPVVWGAFVWDRSLVGALLIVVAAAAYARVGTVHRTLFGALVVSAVVLLTATVHQLTHARSRCLRRLRPVRRDHRGRLPGGLRGGGVLARGLGRVRVVYRSSSRCRGWFRWCSCCAVGLATAVTVLLSRPENTLVPKL